MQLLSFATAAVLATHGAAYDILNVTSQDGQCKTCHTAMAVVNPALTSETLTQVVTLFFQLQGLSRPDLEATSFLTALQGLVLTPDFFCAQTVKVCAEPHYEMSDLQEDVKAIMSEKSAGDDQYIDRLYAGIAADPNPREMVTFIQFADTHMDYKYQEGATADCGLNYCCRTESETGSGSIKAGKFGSRNQRCDVPATTVESVMDQIVDHGAYHYFWSGDNTAHDDPFVSQEEVDAELQAVKDVVAAKLGPEVLTVAMGNHDAFPNGQWDFAGQGPSQQGRKSLRYWVPEAEWDRWDQHGYYAENLPELETRILSLNTESCDFHNLLLWQELYDPNDQLKFIEENLRELEQMGWKAVILGHIPDECSHEYTERFRAMLDRFQKTVRLNMFGHVHTDIYKLVGSMEDVNKPVGVIQVCGGITTWLGNNPAYCVYELDKETMLPVSRKTYSFDLDQANETGVAEWKLMTDWTREFGLADLSPSSMAQLASSMASDNTLAADFVNQSRRFSDSQKTACDENCVSEHVCEVKYIDPYQQSTCRGEPIYNWAGDFMGAFRLFMLEPWYTVAPTPQPYLQ